MLGLSVVAMGMLPVLASLEFGPIGSAGINGPAWLGVVAGGVFIAGGLAIVSGPSMPLLTHLFAIGIVGGLAVIGNWIAFGVGERTCQGSIFLVGFGGAAQSSDLGCRIPFGLGAIIVNAFVVYAVVSLLQRTSGGPPRFDRLLKVAEWLLVLSLVPFLLIVVVLAGVKIGAAAVWTRLKTGAWPRNEAFIERRRLRRLVRRAGRENQ